MDGLIELGEDAVGAFGFEAEHLGIPSVLGDAGFEGDGVVDGEVAGGVAFGVAIFCFAGAFV